MGCARLVEWPALNPEAALRVNARKSARCCWSSPGSARSHRLGRDLFDVVHQAVQLQLCAHLGVTAQREAAHALAVVDIGGFGFDHGDT
jgi:hypothetical protein